MITHLIICLISLFSAGASANTLPAGFVYLHDIAPSIVQEMRYASYHNFIGYPLPGYDTAECIVTKPTALALYNIQEELKRSSLSLKVYDCYRPQMTVNAFIAWSKLPQEQAMKAEFYPRVNKADFFKLGYVAAKSGHSRGSTVDLTIIPLPIPKQAIYHKAQPLIDCAASAEQRFQDNSIDMGTGFDCMDLLSHPLNTQVSATAYHHRMLLRNLMVKHGFNPIEEEWWHFTLKNEPFKKTYFNFPVR